MTRPSAAAADTDVVTLIERMRQGGIDAIAFTSLQQVERLFRVAEAKQRGSELQKALARVVVAAVEPLVVDALAAHDVRVQVIPAESYYLKPLMTALIGALAR